MFEEIEPKVSVIIPVYNAQRFLSKCVDSILHQTYANIELILVDDASPDECPIICDNYAQQDARVKVIHKANEGAALARKTGVVHATGEYVTFVDSDDWIDPLFIEEMLSIAQEYKVDAVVSSFLRNDGNKEWSNSLYFSEGFFNKERLQNEIYPQMLSAKPFFTFGIPAAMWGKLFKVDIVKKQLYIDYKNITFGEDGCFTYSALLDCDSIFITHSAHYINRVNPSSITHTCNPKFLNETENLKKCLLQIAENKQWAIDRQLDEYLMYVCWFSVSNILQDSGKMIKQHKKTMNQSVNQYVPYSVLKSHKFLALPLKNRLIYYLLFLRCYRILKMIIGRNPE